MNVNGRFEKFKSCYIENNTKYPDCIIRVAQKVESSMMVWILKPVRARNFTYYFQYIN